MTMMENKYQWLISTGFEAFVPLNSLLPPRSESLAPAKGMLMGFHRPPSDHGHFGHVMLVSKWTSAGSAKT